MADQSCRPPPWRDCCGQGQAARESASFQVPVHPSAARRLVFSGSWASSDVSSGIAYHAGSLADERGRNEASPRRLALLPSLEAAMNIRVLTIIFALSVAGSPALAQSGGGGGSGGGAGGGGAGSAGASAAASGAAGAASTSAGTAGGTSSSTPIQAPQIGRRCRTRCRARRARRTANRTLIAHSPGDPPPIRWARSAKAAVAAATALARVTRFSITPPAICRVRPTLV